MPTAAAASPERSGIVTVCRGCCCGTNKHPDVDHASHLQRLSTALSGYARIRVTGCLNSCEHSNVIVVSPSPTARAVGARGIWLRQVLDDDTLAAVVGWVRAGGPGVQEIPPALATHVLPAARLRRAPTDAHHGNAAA